jgi:hypothetical protein
VIAAIRRAAPQLSLMAIVRHDRFRRNIGDARFSQGPPIYSHPYRSFAQQMVTRRPPQARGRDSQLLEATGRRFSNDFQSIATSGPLPDRLPPLMEMTSWTTPAQPPR